MSDEPKQHALFDVGHSWDEAWKGMPEFLQANLQPFQTINVHFETREDVEAFAKLVGQRITLDTKFIWYPEMDRNDFSKVRYVDEEK